MARRRLFIAMPTYSGKVRPQTEAAIKAALPSLGSKYDYDFRALSGMCYLDTARNLLAKGFLDSRCDDMLFVDDDVVFPRDAFTRMRDFTPELVAAVYPKKQTPLAWPADLAKPARTHPEGLIEALVLPTGMMRVRREVFETLADKVETYVSGDTPPMKAFFKTAIRDGKYWGEDTEFCRLWHEAGGAMWAVADMPMGHVDQHGRMFSGNYGPSLLAEYRRKKDAA